MDKYLGIYSTSGDVQTAIENEELKKPYVAIVNGELDYNSIGNPEPTPSPSESGSAEPTPSPSESGSPL